MTRHEVLQSMIGEYRRKIETYQTMIAEWEQEIGGNSQSLQTAGETPPSGKKTAASGGDVMSLVRDYQFFGKSQPEAAKLLLEMVGHPLKTGVILAAVEKGGLKIGGKSEKDRKQNFYTILNRSSDLGRVARDTWGVVGWPGVPKKQAGDNGTKAEESSEPNSDGEN